MADKKNYALGFINTEDNKTYNYRDSEALHTEEKGSNNGLATLDENGKVPTTLLPDYNVKAIDTVVQTTPTITQYSKGDVDGLLNNKVDKIPGKQLSTNDFTNSLKERLESLSNYDDTEVRELILTLNNALDTLTGTNNITEAIDSVNEIITFLDSFKNNKKLTNVLATLEESIHNWVLQKGYITSSAIIGKQDTIDENNKLPIAYVLGLTITESSVSNGTTTFNKATKSSLGLDQVDNTSDINKPISTATQTELDKRPKVIEATLVTTPTTNVYTRAEVDILIGSRLEKVVGKGLSTIDFTDTNYNHTDNNYTTEEKEKLASISEGAEANTITGVKGSNETNYRTGNISISKDDIGLSNVENKSSSTIRSEITKNNVTNALGFTPINTEATTSASGLMSKDDKAKLNNITSSATKTEASSTNGNIKINGIETTVYKEVANIVHDDSYKHITVTESSVSDGTTTFNKYAHPGSGTNPHNTTKSDVGLSNVDNTSDKDKPVSDATWLELNKKPNMINTSTTSTPNTTLYTKEEVNTLLNNKVDKVIGKLLSTNDFSTALKEKLESLSNYNDSEVRTLISSLQSSLDTLSGTNDTTDIIDTMNEIIAFLNTFKNNNNLSLVLSSLETTIHNWVLNRGYVSASDYNALLSRLTLMTCGGIVTSSTPVLPSRATTIVLNTSTNTISANVGEVAAWMDVETAIYEATFKVSSINGTYHLVPSNFSSLNVTLDGLGTAGNTITIHNPDGWLIRSVDIKA